MISFLSLLILIAGLLPFFGDKFPIPNKGIGYSIVLIVLGILIVIFGIINNLLLGLEKFIIIIEGILVVCIGILPFLPNFLNFLPREGILYNGAVMLLGILGLIYGLIGMG